MYNDLPNLPYISLEELVKYFGIPEQLYDAEGNLLIDFTQDADVVLDQVMSIISESLEEAMDAISDVINDLASTFLQGMLVRFSDPLEQANTIKDYRLDELPNEVRTLVKSLCWHSTSDIETCISILNSHVCTSREDYTEVFNSWHIEDVKTLRNDLTDDQCRDVLDSVILNHDAGQGINWYVIETVIDELFPQPTAS